MERLSQTEIGTTTPDASAKSNNIKTYNPRLYPKEIDAKYHISTKPQTEVWG
jgi:hypothetical protein